MINKIKDLLINTDGFSLDFTTKKSKNINKGFSVSITNNILLDLKENTIKKLIGHLEITGLNLCIEPDKLLIGGWKNKNFHYLDLSVIIEDKKEALIVAKLFNQKAIWDFKKCKEVLIK